MDRKWPPTAVSRQKVRRRNEEVNRTLTGRTTGRPGSESKERSDAQARPVWPIREPASGRCRPKAGRLLQPDRATDGAAPRRAGTARRRGKPTPPMRRRRGGRRGGFTRPESDPRAGQTGRAQTRPRLCRDRLSGNPFMNVQYYPPGMSTLFARKVMFRQRYDDPRPCSEGLEETLP